MLSVVQFKQTFLQNPLAFRHRLSRVLQVLIHDCSEFAFLPLSNLRLCGSVLVVKLLHALRVQTGFHLLALGRTKFIVIDT